MSSGSGVLTDTVRITGGLPDMFTNLIGETQIFGVIKWLAVLGLVMYAIFALVVIKQVGIMTESVESETNGLVKLMAWIHFFGAILLVVAAIVIL